MRFNDEGGYFWASYASQSKTVMLFTNPQQDLILQNKAEEQHFGIISGEMYQDAWAIFRHTASTGDNGTKDIALPSKSLSSMCGDISGNYKTAAQSASPQGVIDSVTAEQLFFKEDIVGPQKIHQTGIASTHFEIKQDQANTIEISLYAENEFIASRRLPHQQIRCQEGKWYFSGKVKSHSLWLVMAASAGIYWEDIYLSKNVQGVLVAESQIKNKGLLFLIPIGHQQNTVALFAPVDR